MARYELIEGTSSKFWEIKQEGVNVTVKWGKVGTAGQSNVKTFATAAEAKKEHDKLVGEKTRKGYRLAGGGASAKAAPAQAAKAGTAFKMADVDRLGGSPRDHATKFMGQKIADFDPDEGLKDPARKAYRILQDDSFDDFLETFAKLVADPGAAKLKALVIGGWSVDQAGGTADDGYARKLRKAIIDAADKLTGLAALFINDTHPEEYEVSWQYFTDLAPLLDAYPGLEHLRVRGDATAKGKMGMLRSKSLRSLQLEGSSLSRKLVQQVAAAELPALEYLEIWLGPEDYADKKPVADFAPILSGKQFPKLRYLGLRDSDTADDVAKAVAKAPILGQLETLDLSLGTLGDAGIEALLASPEIAKLQTLDVRFHYASKAVRKKLKALPIKVMESPSERLDDEDDDEPGHRYVTVGE
ncbi:MAG: WGR domain-containing protein [Byssovorax sp.]